MEFVPTNRYAALSGGTVALALPTVDRVMGLGALN